MSVFQEQREISMDCINDSLASGVISKRRRVEDRAVTPVVLGGNIYKLVVVSFGLLCILQAVLNVSLRYALNASDKKTSGTDTCSKNQTEELDRLRRKLINSDASDKKTSGPDTCSKNQTEELDRLRRKLINAAGTATELDHLKRACQRTIFNKGGCISIAASIIFHQCRSRGKTAETTVCRKVQTW
ncbi:hypothetical protein INR49_026392 [Caranx melampygus]|nr:hypothetical protein INR49_026392 [Caranx melampygus]